MTDFFICGDYVPTKSNEDNFINGQIGKVVDDKLLRLMGEFDQVFCNLEDPITNATGVLKKAGPNLKSQ